MAIAEPVIAASELEEGWQQWPAGLQAQFVELSTELEPVRLYILADSRANPGLNKLLVQVPELQWASLWHGSVFESYTDIAPYLIQIDQYALEDSRSLMHRLARRLWREANGLHMLTWIWSPVAMVPLSQHFRAYCSYALPDRRAFFLHFYDNRILQRLRAVWTDAEARRFLAPCNEIWYRDRELNDVVWLNAEPAVPAVVANQQNLTDDQHAQLIRLGHADKVALQLRTLCGDALDGVSQHELYRRVVEQLERAGQYRIADADDLLSYVSKGVMLSARFDEHPVIKDQLTRAARGEMTSREALTQIDEDVLRQAARMHEA